MRASSAGSPAALPRGCSLDVCDGRRALVCSPTMKILFLGDIGPGQTSLMRMRALLRLGHEVVGVNTVAPWKRVSWLSRQLQRRAQRGPVIRSINAAVMAAAIDFRPGVIWAEKQESLTADVVEKLRERGIRLIHFTPDPYFSLPWKRTAIMDESISRFDVLLYCKQYERAAYEGLGGRSVYMPLGFCDEVHRPIQSVSDRWRSHVGFLGGWEPRREHLLGAIAAMDGDLKIWGGYWEFLRDGRWTPRRHIILRQLAGGERFRIHRNEALARCVQGGEVYGDDYARALSGAGIGLGFLRKVCPDQHTTRTFEIPACGSMLLADRTDEHCEFFTEGKEAEFFSSEGELADKFRYYRQHEPARQRIAAAGYRRCYDSGYSYVSRLRAVLSVLSDIIPRAQIAS